MTWSIYFARNINCKMTHATHEDSISLLYSKHYIFCLFDLIAFDGTNAILKNCFIVFWELNMSP